MHNACAGMSRLNRPVMTIADNNSLDILSLDGEDLQAPRPPFTEETAILKVQLSEDAWNSRDPERVALACTLDSEWRNRSECLRGRQQIVTFLTRKWEGKLEYRLRKTLWTFTDDHIAVRFEYEWPDHSGQWFRSHGNENWEFAANGLLARRFASINDQTRAKAERKFLWPRDSSTPTLQLT
jgi:nuclear transport factor 2 (NTF2) superfamily protein